MPTKSVKKAASKKAKPSKTAKSAKSAKSAMPAKVATKTAKRVQPVKAAKADGAGPLRAYIAKLAAWQAKLLGDFDAVVAQEVPNAVRAVKWSAAFYGMPGGGWFAAAKGFSKHVKVTFFAGTSLNPVPPSGESENGRAQDLREGDAFDAKRFASWVKQASTLPGWGNT